MNKILITGSKGQLGIALKKQLDKREDVKVILTDVDELDISNLSETQKFIKNIKPNVIMNCAAYTAVDACEDNIDSAYKVNSIGARNLTIASDEIKAKIMHVSTDYVFDGTASSPYKEFDSVNPISVYGKSKLAGENFVKELSNRYFIIRTAWLYGEGKNFVKTMLTLSETRSEINVVSDQFGTPTSTLELAKMMEYLMDTEEYGIYHGTCEGMTNWYEFTKEIFRVAGKSTKVIPITTAEYPTKAVRPIYSVLDNYMLKLTSSFKFAEWEEGVRVYLKEIL